MKTPLFLILFASAAFSALPATAAPGTTVLDCYIESSDESQTIDLMVDENEYTALLRKTSPIAQGMLDIADRTSTPNLPVALSLTRAGLVHVEGDYLGMNFRFEYENKATRAPSIIRVKQSYEGRRYDFTMRCQVNEFSI